jgi:hypothetical protein
MNPTPLVVKRSPETDRQCISLGNARPPPMTFYFPFFDSVLARNAGPGGDDELLRLVGSAATSFIGRRIGWLLGTGNPCYF